MHHAPIDVLPFGPEHPWLAPLAGYSDLPFRLLCREYGASVACTEMLSAKGLVYGQGKKNNATESLLATVPALDVSSGTQWADTTNSGITDTPLVVQLFGAEAPFLERAVNILLERGFRWFDLNMGCSVPKVGKSGSGSAMLNDVPNALAVAKAMIGAAGAGKVGFKLRLGRQAGEEVYLPLAKALEDLGAGWITLHPRYAKQGFSGTANWKALIPLVKELSIPVIASGDLLTPQDGVRCIQETGVTTVMFARGAMSNPAIFTGYRSLLQNSGGNPESVLPGVRETEAIIRRHASLAKNYTEKIRNGQGIELGLLKMRTFVPRYIKRFTGARALRQALCHCTSWSEMDALLANFFQGTQIDFANSEETHERP